MSMLRTLLATAAAIVTFLAYLQVVVPWIEGQSADRVPEIDLLGVLRVEQPGQWMSLFPEDSWQRDQNNRNIIHADGNIVMFRNYTHEPDGGLRVGGLTLLLFEEGSANESPLNADPANTLAGNAIPSLLPQRPPVVIEALDDAVLVFDNQKAAGLNRYGDLKQVQFLGRVKFWRSGGNNDEPFTIHTRELTITGSEATTKEAVEFQFGATNGVAKGLQLTFDNSGSLHSHNAALTKIVGMRHMRLQQVERLDMIPDGATKPISLSCTGPAEFSFSRMTAKVLKNVRVFDHDSGHEITGEAIFIQFKAPQTSPNPTSSPKTAVFPKEMTAKELWVYGPPAQVLHREQEFQLRSSVLHYLVDQQEFVAGPLPKSGAEAWMLDALQSSNSLWSGEDVHVVRGALSMRVPTLRYRSTSPPKAKGDGTAPEWSEGEFAATGPGVVNYQSAPNRAPLAMYFQDRLLANPDPEDPTRWLISILGQTEAHLDSHSQVHADSLYLWMHKVPVVGLSAKPATHWEPDLLLAQGKVRMLGEKVRAAVREARVYFPTPQPAVQLDSPTEAIANRGEVSNPIANQGRAATVNYEEPVVAEVVPNPIRGADVTADAMIVQLDWAPLAAAGAKKQDLATDASARYRVQSIDLDGHVVIEEAVWNDETSGDSSRLPNYQMFGDRVVGIAAESAASEPTRSSNLAKSPEFVWTVSATTNQPARLLTSEVDLNCEEFHFDQSQQVAWADKPGTISFVIPANLSVEPGPNNKPAEATQATTELPPGRGSAKWQRNLQFNGRDFVLEGQVQLEIERPLAEKRIERLQAYGERLTIELSEPVKMDGGDNISGNRTARRIALYPSDQPDAAGVKPPVRVYHQQRTPENELLTQEVIWATGVELEPKQNSFRISGPGSLWTMRRETDAVARVATATAAANELSFLKVQFQRSMEGQWSEGQVQLFGPVAALYGKATDWQVMDQESRLRQPLRITSDTMTIDRWQTSPRSTPELEWEADGRVHVLGEDFEGTAQRINFAQSQDLLTLRGDGRAPAKFWQTSRTTSERNHLSAQKIRYRPKQEDFDFEGFQEGNLNFFSGRRGGLK